MHDNHTLEYTYVQSSIHMCDNAYVQLFVKISMENPDVPDSLTCLIQYIKTMGF